jgi:hypothetical protein
MTRADVAEEHRKWRQIAAQHDEVYARLAPWMGTYTAAVCDPRQYANARQLEKACGLNLREKSSGEHRGQLHITKRRPGAVRQALCMFTLRMIESSAIVLAWYKRRHGYTEGTTQILLGQKRTDCGSPGPTATHRWGLRSPRLPRLWRDLAAFFLACLMP